MEKIIVHQQKSENHLKLGNCAHHNMSNSTIQGVFSTIFVIWYIKVAWNEKIRIRMFLGLHGLDPSINTQKI